MLDTRTFHMENEPGPRGRFKHKPSFIMLDSYQVGFDSQRQLVYTQIFVSKFDQFS